MEGLEYLLDYDAARSLHWPRRAIVASAPEGLTTEYLAADKAIAMLEKILGDHRALAPNYVPALLQRRKRTYSKAGPGH